jgi:hypothetical protein
MVPMSGYPIFSFNLQSFTHFPTIPNILQGKSCAWLGKYRPKVFSMTPLCGET